MGVLDDAIREHLELKRQHGASADEVVKQEQEALGAVQGQPVTSEPAADVSPPVEPEAPAPVVESAPAEAPPVPDEPVAADAPEDAVDEVASEPGPEPWLEPAPEAVPAGENPGEEDVLEETPEFLQETPEHDRLWFEQKPPREFDFDDE
ncbi:MAG TPA: hypothetical protein VEX36_11820 [Thermoleophilaceae bacterium]|nr:hypothetical protein [Thermoleophilaceae bacterium]